MPLNIEVSKLPFPIKLTNHPFAITWKACTVVWGGGITPLSAFYIHASGQWTLKNADGDAPEAVIQMVNTVHVHRIGNKMLVFGGDLQDIEFFGDGDGSVVYW